MSNSRQKAEDNTLIDLLNINFRNPVLLQKCRESSKQWLQNPPTTNRVFNDFPTLITMNELQAHASRLTLIITDVSSHELDAGTPQRILNSLNKRQLSDNVRKIAYDGCHRLLKDGHVRNDIAQLLEWQPFKNDINIRALLCAYTATTFLDIIKTTKEQSNVDDAAFHAVNEFISKHCHRLVIEAIQLSGNKREEHEHGTGAHDAVAVGLTALAAAAGSVALGAAIVVGYTLFAAARGGSESPSPEPDRQDRFLY